jgi:hypothetical protein
MHGATIKKNIVCVKNAARNLKIHKKQKNLKQLLSYLYVYRLNVNMEFVMEKFVNILGVPLNSTKPRPNERIVGGFETGITGFPYQVWRLHCFSV